MYDWEGKDIFRLINSEDTQKVTVLLGGKELSYKLGNKKILCMI
jgi:hypothetical protein